MNSTFEIGLAHAGKRLDRVLRECCPEFSLRGARRFIQTGKALLNGNTGTPSMKVKNGDELEIKDCLLPVPSCKPCLLDIQFPYCCFWKPARMYSTILSGGDGLALEHFVEETGIYEKPELLQRLDFGTCGLVCAAFNIEAMQAFRKAEKARQCDKFYYALLDGKLERSLRVNNALDTAHRKKTRVLAASSDRQTCIEPLGYFNANDFPGFGGSCRNGFTLALCRLNAGQRHQIRAHAAHIGHPLAGDTLYGSTLTGDFMLEHFRLEFPGHVFQMPMKLSIFQEWTGGVFPLLNKAGCS